MMKTPAYLISVLAVSVASCAKTPGLDHEIALDKSDLRGLSKATFASGCFWCAEAIYESVRGVHSAVSGYAGGHTTDPTYTKVNTERTGHAEAVQVYYNPDAVSYAELINVYFGSQDPTQINGQGPDIGSSYRSIIFYRTAEEKETAENAKATLSLSGRYEKPIGAEILPITDFYKAEDYHQDYEHKHSNNPYIRTVSVPRLNHFKKMFPELLK